MFDGPVKVTIVADVTTLNQSQRASLAIYQAAGEGGSFEAVPGSMCAVVEDEAGAVATCMAEVTHFCRIGVIAGADTDGDGILNQFGEVDNCPRTSAPALPWTRLREREQCARKDQLCALLKEKPELDVPHSAKKLCKEPDVVHKKVQRLKVSWQKGRKWLSRR